MTSRLAFLVALLVATAGVHAGTFYKCNVGGRVVYQDSPCKSGGGEIELKPLTMMDGSSPGTAKPAGPYQSAVWYSDFAGYTMAVRESQRTGAPLLVFFYTDWCPYCKNFRAKVLPDAAVVQRLRRFVKVSVNTEHGTQENALFKQSGGNGIPYVIVQPAGGAAGQLGAAQDPREFAQTLDAHLLPSR